MTNTTERETYKIGQTTFDFPALPPRKEMAPLLFDSIREKRDAVLDKARAVRPTRRTRFSGGSAYRTPKPGTGEFTPANGKPGSVITLSDGREAEVWSLAPGVRAVWAIIRESGACIYATQLSTGEWLGDRQRAC